MAKKKKDKKEKTLSDELRDLVFTSSAGDVLYMYGLNLNDYKPVFVNGFYESEGGFVSHAREEALEDLVKQAKELGCRFVVDVRSVHTYGKLARSVEYLGTGLIRRDK